MWSHHCWAVVQNQCLAPLAALLLVHSLVQGLLWCRSALLPPGNLLPPKAPRTFSAEVFLAGWPRPVLLQAGPSLFSIPEARLCLDFGEPCGIPISSFFRLLSTTTLPLSSLFSPQTDVIHKQGVSSVLSSRLSIRTVNCNETDTTSYCLPVGLCTTNHSPLNLCTQLPSHPSSHSAIQTRPHQSHDKETLGYCGKDLAKVRVHADASQGLVGGWPACISCLSSGIRNEVLIFVRW